jgi:hypothetical protein
VITQRYDRYHARVHANEAVVAAVVTASVAGASYATFNYHSLVDRTDAVAFTATCRAVDTAIVGYVAENGVAPSGIAQLKPYVRGDISAYRIVHGRAAGPGCPA